MTELDMDWQEDDEASDPGAPTPGEKLNPCKIRVGLNVNNKSRALLDRLFGFMRAPLPLDQIDPRDESDRIVYTVPGVPCKAWHTGFVANGGLSLHFSDYGVGKWTLIGGTVGWGSCATNAEIQEAAEAILAELTKTPSLFEDDGPGLIIRSPYALDPDVQRVVIGNPQGDGIWPKLAPSLEGGSDVDHARES